MSAPVVAGMFPPSLLILSRAHGTESSTRVMGQMFAETAALNPGRAQDYPATGAHHDQHPIRAHRFGRVTEAWTVD